MSAFGDDLEYRREIVSFLQGWLGGPLSVPKDSRAFVGRWLAVLNRDGVPDRSRTSRHELFENGDYLENSAYRTPAQIDAELPVGQWQYHSEGVLLLRTWFNPVPEHGLLEGGIAEEAYFVRQTPAGRLVVFNDDASVVYVWERVE